MIFPELSKFDNYKSYFEEFIRVNKEDEKTPMSYQFIATKLNWPRSYLNDVINGRKNLTVTRVLEFAQFANMNVYDTEKLLYMSLRDSTNESVGKFFEQQLTINFNTEKPAYEKTYDAQVNAFKEIALWQYIDITNKIPTLEILKESVTAFQDTTKEEFDHLLKVLAEDGAIQINPDGTGKKLKENLWVSSDVETQKKLAIGFAESIIQFISNPVPPKANFNFMFFLVESEVKPFQEKIFKLMNWLNDFIKSSETRHLDPTVKLFQFSINLFPLSKFIGMNAVSDKKEN